MTISRMLISLIDSLYIKPLERVMSRYTFGYILCGGANMMLDTLWYYLTYHYVVFEQNIDLGIVVISPHIAALIIVFPITFFTGFLLNRYVAFRSTEQRTQKQLMRYALSVIGSILLNYILVKLFVEVCHIWPTVSKMITTIIVALYSFLAARYFTFRR